MNGDLFDRIFWGLIRFVFLPAMLLMGVAIVVLFVAGIVSLAAGADLGG